VSIVGPGDGLKSDAYPRSIYHATIATYFIALFHFGSEYGIFKTANMGGGVISPLIVASKFPLFFDSNLITEH
jgi:Erg28 like protein